MAKKGVWKCAPCIKRLGASEEMTNEIVRDKKSNRKVRENY